ncbi:MAG: hypothetical protein ACK52I_00920 [Pseudomonadota bacterium]|jgi:tetratricopeptide (TPR) repeat protein
MNSSTDKLNNYILNPNDPVANYELGMWYHHQQQYGGSLSFFLRTAELTDDQDLAYKCLLLNALNFRKQGKRNGSQKNQLLHAITLLPDRPEAYFLLSRFYEETKSWHESYAIASIALQRFDDTEPSHELDYPGRFGFMYQKAIASWWMCKFEESKNLFSSLLCNVPMPDEYVKSCRDNLMKITGKAFVP